MENCSPNNLSDFSEGGQKRRKTSFGSTVTSRRSSPCPTPTARGSSSPRFIHLNVGGTRYTTTKTTLRYVTRCVSLHAFVFLSRPVPPNCHPPCCPLVPPNCHPPCLYRRRVEDSMLSNMFSGRYAMSPMLVQGDVFIDR